jgi:hypothetical protein
MPRYNTPPLTIADVWQDGPPLRLRDLVAITGLTPETVRAEIAARQLTGHRLAGNGYWMIQRAEARRWLAALGFSIGDGEEAR